MKWKPYILLAILLITAFGSLSYWVSIHPINQLDIDISRFVQQQSTDGLDKLMRGISFFADSPYIYFPLILVTALIFSRKYRREAYFMLALIPCSLLIVGMKNISNRPRPTSDLVRVMEPFLFQSFPSSHVFSYTLFFGLLLVFMCSIKSITKSLRITLGVVSGFFLVLIAPSRIYLGAHWFTDTLGGVLFGSLVLLPLSFFYFKANREAKS